MSEASSSIYDYIIIGAGSAGCVLANRLSANPQTRVLVLEAGGNDNWIWFHIPVGYLFAIGNPRADWLFKTEPVPGLNGRVLNYPRGKVIGGSSAINAMIYMRGQSSDYDAWSDLGLTGWGWDDVKPLFMQHEDYFSGANQHHGAGGEWRVDKPRMNWEILDRFIEAAGESGIPKTSDFNTGNNEGISYFQVNQKNGRRWSTARGFLKPVLNRPNLDLMTGAEAERILFEGKRATGVSFIKNNIRQTATAKREVILSAGAIATPKLLQLSGIGQGALLQSLGLPVVHELQGVGKNLQDHLQIRPIYKVEGTKTLNTYYQSWFNRAVMGLEYVVKRTGPLTMAPSQLGAFTRSNAEFANPNVQFHVQPLSLDKFGEPMHSFNAITVSVCNLRPKSRGYVRITSPDMHIAPAIQPNYLSEPEDKQVAIDSIKLVRRIMNAPSLQAFNPQEYKPGAHLISDEELVMAAGDVATTIFHPVGTAKMGIAADKMAVVDEQLRVYGLQGLRIADASVMPNITSGNTNSPTIMIAEKAAQMILEDWRG
jgi:choline dehydrogenase